MCLTGRQDAEIFRSEKMEALAGRDVALPCIVEGSSSIHVSMIEWTKSRSENRMLALYSSVLGKSMPVPNITLEVDNTTMATWLHLPRVREWDSGVYICRLSTFPLGTITRETELKVTGKKTKLLLTFRCSAVTFYLNVAYDPRCC